MILLGKNKFADNLPTNVHLREARALITQALGIRGGSTRSSPLAGDEAFSRPRLGFQVLAHGIGTETLDRFDLRNIRALLGNEPSVSLTGLSYPRDPVALSASVATGEAPRVHGIVGSKWRSAGRSELAFDGNHALVATLSDLVSSQYGPESMSVSVSSDRAESAAHAPHGQKPNAHACSFDADKGTFCADSSEPALRWSLRTALAQLESSGANDLWSHVRTGGGDVFYSKNDDSVAVKADGSSSTVRFRMADPTDAALVAELLYAKTLAKRLATATSLQRKIADRTPDTLVVSLRGLDAVGRKYGFDSEEYKAALKLYDSALPLIARSLETLAPGASIGEVILMGSPAQLDYKTLAGQVKRVSAVNSGRTLLPSVYINDAQAKHEACQLLRANVDMLLSNVQTFCPGEAAAPSFVEEVSLLSLSATTSNSTVTDTDIMKYQICLWIGLALTFSMLAGVLTFCGMEYERDTMLFSKRRIKPPNRYRD